MTPCEITGICWSGPGLKSAFCPPYIQLVLFAQSKQDSLKKLEDQGFFFLFKLFKVVQAIQR